MKGFMITDISSSVSLTWKLGRSGGFEHDLVLGPGDIAQAHTKDEWLERSQLLAAAALYGAILRLPGN